jgi:Type IV secretion system pilin
MYKELYFMKKIKTIIVSLSLALGLVTVPLMPLTAAADDANPAQSIGQGVTAVGGKSTGGSGEFTTGIKNVVNTLLFLLGVVAVIAIIIGGFRYATSNGDAGQIKAAKDIILYAVVGLVVAILAYAIVNFVISTFGTAAGK